VSLAKPPSIAELQVCVLLGGLGLRVRHLAPEIPKPLLPVPGGPTFLHFLMRQLLAVGFRKFVFLVGYRAAQIAAAFPNDEGGVPFIEYSFDPELLGTGGALQRAAHLLEERFFLLYGDTWAPMDYATLLEEAIASDYTMLMAVTCPEAIGARCGNILSPHGRFARDYSTRRDAWCALVDAGAMIVRRDALQYLPVDGRSSFEEHVYGELIRRGELVVRKTSHPFYDIGTDEGRSRFLAEVCLRSSNKELQPTNHSAFQSNHGTVWHRTHALKPTLRSWKA
jgi:NDP-sugar pyrophosphorylase family protein